MHNKNRKKIYLLLALITIGAFSVAAQAGNQQKIWPTITNQMKPWTRWWWMGNAVDKKNLEIQLNGMDSVGIGGVEITPIYGVKGGEASYINFLSPEWMEMLRYTVDKSRQLGMGVDMNVGTGWPFGGPHITPAFAAGRLLISTYTLDGGQPANIKILPPQNDSTIQQYGATLKALTAYGSNGEVINLVSKVSQDGQLNWTAPAGHWELYAGFGGKTGQMVKRAAPGGEGLVMDHLDPAAVAAYLHRFDAAFGSNPVGVRSFFNDSYEVYFADFTPDFFEEFQQRRGYDVRQYLKQLVSKKESDTTIRVRGDYRQTMAELVYENFAKPWHQWVKKHNGLSRNQAHDFPGNLLDLYAAVDIPEPEMFGIIPVAVPGMKYYTDYGKTVHAAPDPVMVKFAASAAGAYGKPLVSCETFTWMGEHFQVPLSHCKPEVQQAFLAGVNHIFFHGTTYSPQEAAWPGWLFYASVNFAPSNSFWPHLGGLNSYIARTQSILQNSTWDNELMVYWPADDVRHHAGKGTMLQMLEINKINDWLQPGTFYKEVTKLLKQGYQLDYVSDNYLKAASVVNKSDIKIGATGTPHKVLVIPETSFMPLATFEKVLQLANDGATVILQKLPTDVPGFKDMEQRRQHLKTMIDKLSFTEAVNDVQKAVAGKGQVLVAPDIQKGLQFASVRGETITGSGLQFIRKIRNNGKSYYVVNHTDQDIDEWLTINTPANTVTILDPQYGRYGLADIHKENESTKVHIQVPAGDALFIETSAINAPVNKWVYTKASNESITIKTPWKLYFTTGGPNLPKDQFLNKLVSWTDLDGDEAKRFSGTGVYETTFRLPAKDAYDYELDLGDVRESARIVINGKDAGIVWHVPSKIKIGKFLKPGENTLRIEVANLMANRIIDLDKRKVEWRKFKEINFVNINYQEFDASGWSLQPSGLLGPVTLIPIEQE